MIRKMNCVIIMTGFTATGKSTTAEKLSEYLGTDIYHSAVVRDEMGLTPAELGYEFDLKNPIFVKKVSPLVYGEMARRAKETLRIGRNAVLDASYSFFWQRSQIYRLAQAFNAEIYILKCVCSNEGEIKKRLYIRKEDSKKPLNEAPSWKTYVSTEKYAEPIEEDVLPNGMKPKIIEYDTYKKTIKTSNIEKSDKIASEVIRCLDTWQDNGLLNTDES